MIKFQDLKLINSRFEAGFSNAYKRFLDSGYYILGHEVKTFESAFANYCGTKHCIGTANGLDALILVFQGFKALGQLKEGDEVIVPANTYIASILSVSFPNLAIIEFLARLRFNNNSLSFSFNRSSLIIINVSLLPS